MRETLSWERHDLPVPASLRGMSTPAQGVIWVGGSGGALFRSIDNGSTWAEVAPPDSDTLDFRDVEAFDREKAVVMSAGPGAASRIFLTADGGKHWEESYQNGHPQGFFNAIAFWDEQTGILAGDPIDSYPFLMKTQDGGQTWARVDPQALPEVEPTEYGFAASGTHLFTLSPEQVWLGSGGSRARVFHSADQGTSWEAHATPLQQGIPSAGIFSLCFLNSQTGIAVGGDYQRPGRRDSTLALTKDGGRSWQIPEGALPGFRSAVKPHGEGWIVAGSSGSDHSADGGESWTAIDTLVWNVLSVTPEGDIWVAGSDGKVGRAVITDHQPTLH